MAAKKIQGFRKKPLPIYTVTATYILLPALTLLQISYQLDFTVQEIFQIIFSKYYLFEVFCSVTAAMAIFSVTRAGFVYFLILSTYTIVTKLNFLQGTPVLQSPLTFIVVGIWLWVTGLFMLTTLKIPYLNPKTKWWEQPRRYAYFANCAILAGAYKFPVVTLNMSEGGMLLKLDERLIQQILGGTETAKPEHERRKNPLPPNPFFSPDELPEIPKNLEFFPQKPYQTLRLRMEPTPEAMPYFKNEIFEVDAQLMWLSHPEGTLHYGVGVQFVHLTKMQQKSLKQYLRHLDRTQKKRLVH